MEVQWPLLIFTLFICLGAGIIIVSGSLAGLKKAPKIHFLASVIALVSIIIGGVASFLHLQHWERAFNGFGHLTSGITQELIAIAVLGILIVAYLVLARKGQVPQAFGWIIAVVALITVAVMSSSYNMSARPVWDTLLLGLYYISNALVFGALVVIILAAIKKEDVAITPTIAIVGVAIQAVATAAYAIYITTTASQFAELGNYFDPIRPTEGMLQPGMDVSNFMVGDLALLFWLGVVIVGCLIPLIATLLLRKKEGTQLVAFSGAAVICAMIGGVCFRVIIYLLGFTVFVFY